jgi:hypothetical protein
MQSTDKPKLLEKYCRFHSKPYFIGKVLYRKEDTSHEIQITRNYLPHEDARMKSLAVKLFVFANDLLKVLQHKFEVTDRQISIARLIRPYNDIFWGRDCSIWAQAYIELEEAVFSRYRKLNLVADGLFSRCWLTHCWYFWFARQLLTKTDLKIDGNEALFSGLSRVWLRKFLTQIFVEEVLRASTNMMDIPQKTVREPIHVRSDPEFNTYDSLIMTHESKTEMCEITFWRTGPSIAKLFHLYKSGYTGYSPSIRTNYQNYKEIHRLFGIKGNCFNFREYKSMIGMHSKIELG